MKKLFFFIAPPLLITALFCLSCKDKNYIDKDDLVGTYIVYKGTFLDSSASAKNQPVITWKLSLLENNNFEFSGHGETFSGYWAFAEGDDKKNMLLFQSGYMPERIIYAVFDKTTLLFNGPNSMYDSLFQKLILKRFEK